MKRRRDSSYDGCGARALARVALIALVAGTTIGACTDDTGLRVVIGSDIEDLGSFEVAVWAGEVRREETLRSRRVFVIGEPDGVSLPASMGLVPREGDPLRRVRIEVTGYTPRGTVTRAVTTGFVEGETREVRIDLLGSCEGSRCDFGLTCGAEGCEPEARPASLLPRVGQRPRSRSDAMAAPDLGGRETGGAPDGSVPRDMSSEPDSSVDPDMGPVADACAEGFVEIGASCYRSVGEASSWEDGERACVALGAHLVTLDGESAADLGAIDPHAPWWIGLGPDALIRSTPVPLPDIDDAFGLCGGDMPADLVGEGVVLIDSTGANDDLRGRGAAACLPKLPSDGIPDVGFTARLAARSLLVLRGRPTTASEGAAVVFPLDGSCRSPYSVDDCLVVAVGESSAAFVRGPGDVGVLVEVVGVDIELRIVGLRWTSGAELGAGSIPSDLDLAGVELEELPCMSLTRDGRWRAEACTQLHTILCERPRGSG